jgi:hypothetical protein
MMVLLMVVLMMVRMMTSKKKKKKRELALSTRLLLILLVCLFLFLFLKQSTHLCLSMQLPLLVWRLMTMRMTSTMMTAMILSYSSTQFPVCRMPMTTPAMMMRLEVVMLMKTLWLKSLPLTASWEV